MRVSARELAGVIYTLYQPDSDVFATSSAGENEWGTETAPESLSVSQCHVEHFFLFNDMVSHSVINHGMTSDDSLLKLGLAPRPSPRPTSLSFFSPLCTNCNRCILPAKCFGAACVDVYESVEVVSGR